MKFDPDTDPDTDFEKDVLVSLSLKSREDLPRHLTETNTISPSLAPSGERDGVSVLEEFPLITILEPY